MDLYVENYKTLVREIKDLNKEVWCVYINYSQIDL